MSTSSAYVMLCVMIGALSLAAGVLLVELLNDRGMMIGLRLARGARVVWRQLTRAAS